MNDNFIQNGNAPFLITDLSELAKRGIISVEDVRKMYVDMEKEILLAKYKFPTQKSSDNNYHLWVADPSKKAGRRQLKAKTIDDLKQKAYLHEKGYSRSG